MLKDRNHNHPKKLSQSFKIQFIMKNIITVYLFFWNCCVRRSANLSQISNNTGQKNVKNKHLKCLEMDHRADKNSRISTPSYQVGTLGI